jgi:hypothetical protein
VPAKGGSCPLHACGNSARLQQRPDVARIAGKHQVAQGHQERHMRIDDIGRASLPEQLAYLLALAQGFDADAGQDACEIGLLAAIAPDLAHNRRTRSQRRRLLLEHAQLGTYHAVTTVYGD